MSKRYRHWQIKNDRCPQDFEALKHLLWQNRQFEPAMALDYGDHGLKPVLESLRRAIRANKRIALYADYDVDGTMSCVSWIWFLQAIGYENFLHYIPCRFKEGYGLNLQAVQSLIDDQGAEVIVTMDTGITANEEAAYCRERGVEFICTDHHMIQKEKMPDCIILNPKFHPDPQYQELCGCGITFVLLRQLGKDFDLPLTVWNDLLALTGMATICDVVPLNPVNHKLASMGVQALGRSERPVLKRLLQACAVMEGANEQDIGFRLGPRINAVGRLDHADAVVQAFIDRDPEPLVHYMCECNERRKQLQKRIVDEAKALAEVEDQPSFLFLGGEWHPGVVGIAASKLAESFWCPVWLFQRGEKIGKGSARSIPGFDVTSAMGAAKALFEKFGGHAAAGGFTFPMEHEQAIREALGQHVAEQRQRQPNLWESRVEADCKLPTELLGLELMDTLEGMRPFGHGFSEPRFVVEAKVEGVQYYKDKETGAPRHTVAWIETPRGRQKVLFFNEVYQELEDMEQALFLITASRNQYRGQESLSLYGQDFRPAESPVSSALAAH